MEKSFTWQTVRAMLILFPLLVHGCMPTGALVYGSEDADFPTENFTFSMGGVKILIPLPAGYVETSPALRQAVAAEFTPPENIFGVYAAASGRGAGEDAALTHGRRLFIVSARPEFMRESVDGEFYRAMQRDLARVNGSFSSERIARFKSLAAGYYARDASFAHSLGVCDRGPGSLSLVRIGRAAALGEGRPRPFGEADAEAEMVLIQNVLLMHGRCFNIFFFSPLESESDIYAAIRENKAYLSILESGREGWDRVSPAPDDMAGKSGMAPYAAK